MGTVELAFLSVSPCQLRFRFTTQETCVPAEEAWQTQHNSLRVGGALKPRERERDVQREEGETDRGDTQSETDEETGI